MLCVLHKYDGRNKIDKHCINSSCSSQMFFSAHIFEV